MDMSWVVDFLNGKWTVWSVLLVYLFTQIVPLVIYATADILDHTVLADRLAAPSISPVQLQPMLMDLRRRLFRQFLIVSAMLAGGVILAAAVLYLLYVGSVLHVTLWRYVLMTILVVTGSPIALFGPMLVAKYGLERLWLWQRVRA